MYEVIDNTAIADSFREVYKPFVRNKTTLMSSLVNEMENCVIFYLSHQTRPEYKSPPVMAAAAVL